MDLLPFDYYIQNQPEPTKGCMLAIKDLVLGLDSNVTTSWKYRMPFFCYKGKMFCYLWTDKVSGQPYVGFVEGNRLIHPSLEKGERSRMKILRINPTEDLPLDTLNYLLREALDLFKKEIVKI